MKFKIFAVFFMFAALSALGFAADNSSVALQSQEFSSRYDHLACSVNMVSTMIDDVSANVPQSVSALSGLSDELNSDLATLKGYADSRDKNNFNTFVTGQLKTDMKSSQDSLKAERDKFKTYNLTNETLTTLKNDKSTAISTYQTCNSESEKSIINSRKDDRNNQVNNWDKIIANFNEKGLDTTEMQAVVNDASQISVLLNEASNAGTENETRIILEEIRQLNLHLSARFAIASINSQISKLEANATQLNLTDKINEIKNILSDASTMAVSGQAYSTGEFQKTWDDIKNANEKLKNLVNDFRQERKAMIEQIRAERAGQRAANPGNRTRGNFTGMPRGNFTGGPRGNLSARAIVGIGRRLNNTEPGLPNPENGNPVTQG